MVLYKHFRATSFFNAFLLNSIIITLASVCGYFLHHYLSKFNDKIHITFIILLSVIGTFLITFLIQILMFYTFAYGGGMLTVKNPRKKYHLFGP